MSNNEMLRKEKGIFDRHIGVGSQLLYLTREECEKVGPDMDETLSIVKKTFIAHGKKEYEMPAKIGIHPFADVFYHAMPAYVPGQAACGTKWIECYPRNPKEFNLPQTSGLLIMNEILTGYPVALMDSTWLTAMRTPAVTAIAAAALHPDAESFGMFGCGVQGKGHVQFIVKTLKKLKKIYLYDVREEMIDKLITELQDEVGDIKLIKGNSPEEVAKSCEVLSSATIITKECMAIVKREWVGKGQTILPCDLNTFWDASIQREADKYIVDSQDEHELFANMGYFPEGLPNIVCETGEVIAGLSKGRESKDELIVCSNIGISVMDVAMAKAILDKAIQTETGILLKL